MKLNFFIFWRNPAQKVYFFLFHSFERSKIQTHYMINKYSCEHKFEILNSFFFIFESQNIFRNSNNFDIFNHVPKKCDSNKTYDGP